MITDGLSTENIQRYLRYTAKIGDYLQMAELSSVMVLDHEHRRQVHEENRPWDEIDSDKVYFHLKPFTTSTSGNAPFRQQPVCIRFNNGNCFRTYCKYSHVCMICKGDHPKTQHWGDQTSCDTSAPPPPSHHATPAPPSALNPAAPRFRPF